jgi:hypothetical protein
MDVLENMKNLEGGKKASINEKKASGQELRDYFTKVLPEWDQERVQNSHIKKLITWYNILVEAGITDFKDAAEAPAAEEAPAADEAPATEAPVKEAPKKEKKKK